MKNLIFLAFALALKLNLAQATTTATATVAAPSCANYQSPKTFTETKDKIDQKIKTFANKKAIAKQADNTLSKLITAKSPVIQNWFNKRNLESKSEDEIVREWRLYFARNFVLTKYPYGDAAIDKEIETLVKDINQLFSNKEFQKKMQNLFDRSKKHSLSTVKAFPITDEQKSKISARIEAIKLYWMKEFKTSKFKNLPMDFLDWGIAYDPNANEINMGINALAYPNNETYLAVFAHEIGHSIDSCRWGAYLTGEWPFQAIGECLRTSQSVGAKKRDDSKLELLAKQNKELADSLKANPTCNKLGYPPAGLQADQLPESFADWFSTEVVATIEGIKPTNLRLDLCDAKELQAGSSYISNELRLQKIYFANPRCGWTKAKPD